MGLRRKKSVRNVGRVILSDLPEKDRIPTGAKEARLVAIGA